MSTVIYPSPIFGPVHSRRLGVSLGINLLPGDGKVCTFDCIYCECGFNAQHRTHSGYPTREGVKSALEERLRRMAAEGPAPDVLTFAGNGEPTVHPQFAQIIDDTIALRDRYFPQAKISVLSNATQLGNSAVFEALKRVDNNILKLDTVDADYIGRVDRPTGRYRVEEVLERMRAFEGELIVQTMFLKGTVGDRSVDNTGDEHVLPWMKAVAAIAPRQVMIYTIDRETPQPGLQKATPAELDRIAGLLRGQGITVSVAY